MESGQADGARSGFIGPRLSGCRQALFKLVAVRMGGTEKLGEEEEETARGGRDPLIPSSRPKAAHHHAPHIPITALTLKVVGVKPDPPASIARAFSLAFSISCVVTNLEQGANPMWWRAPPTVLQAHPTPGQRPGG